MAALMNQGRDRASPPRIYYLHPLLAGPLSGWNEHLDACAEMGFGQILMPAPFRPGRMDNIFYPADFEQPHSALHTVLNGAPLIERIAAECQARGLDLLLDLKAGQVTEDGALARVHPEWFDSRQGIDALDPRCSPGQRGLLAFQDTFEADQRYAYIDWWTSLITGWCSAGVTGFLCHDAPSFTTWFWKEIIRRAQAGRAGTDFLAWTPGSTPEQVRSLKGCAFSGVFSSLRWWDCRADWLADEHNRLREIAPPLAFPEEPFGRRLYSDVSEESSTATLERFYRRALELTAATAAGSLVPMGFEYAMNEPMACTHGNPAAFQTARRTSRLDLRRAILETNQALLHAVPSSIANKEAMHPVFGNRAAAAGLILEAPQQKTARLVLVNAALTEAATVALPALDMALEDWSLKVPSGHDGDISEPQPTGRDYPLEAAEVCVLDLIRNAPVRLPKQTRRTLKAALEAPRLSIENVVPMPDEGHAVKCIVGERIDIEADVIIDGHERIAVELLWRAADAPIWQTAPMMPLDNDRWRGSFHIKRLGLHEFTVQAWPDRWQTLRDHAQKKLTAGQDVAAELEEAQVLIREFVEGHRADVKGQIKGQIDEQTPASIHATAALDAALKQLAPVKKKSARRSSSKQTMSTQPDNKNAVRPSSSVEAIEALLDDPTASAMATLDPHAHAGRIHPPLRLEADRKAAQFASWYELFPRSQHPLASTGHGNFDGIIARLPAIRDMGFDVLYLTPIHPIGSSHRKGRNNALVAQPGDPGSPYAIGSADGGHDAIHPLLGDFNDFRRLVAAAADHGLEIALDFAVQCSPDHPWLRQHPEWFKRRPDGTIRHAENPPKKYEDIVNVDFYAEQSAEKQKDSAALWLALRNIVLLWVREGVRIFRVDNPHTKPLPFWQWLIADVRSAYPDTIFLAEAFTRPKLMARLAKIGFTQSYTYFTWRETKAELTEYLNELNAAPLREFFRPHFFVNTPDINPWFLQKSGRAGFVIRAALATLLSGLWGMYSGFELCEAAPLPGKEEYLDSEKYQIRERDFTQPGHIVNEITLLNRIRRLNPALHTHLGLHFHAVANDQLLCFSKTTPLRDNTVLAVICLDPFNVQEAHIEVPWSHWGLGHHHPLHMEDLVHEGQQTWHDAYQHIRLNPHDLPFAVWRVATPLSAMPEC